MIWARKNDFARWNRESYVNSKAAMDRNIQIGDTLTWKFDPKERKWNVVGIIVDSSDGQVNCFVPIDTFRSYAVEVCVYNGCAR